MLNNFDSENKQIKENMFLLDNIEKDRENLNKSTELIIENLRNANKE